MYNVYVTGFERWLWIHNEILYVSLLCWCSQ